MKRALTTLAAAIAVTALAEEPAKTTTTQKPAAQPKTISAPAPQQLESPLVAAARRANRLGKKPTNVITNDTLVRSGVHVTTTEKMTPMNVASTIAQPTAETEMLRLRNEQRKADEARARKEAEAKAKKEQKYAATMERAENGMVDDAEADESLAERDLQKEQSQKPPQF